MQTVLNYEVKDIALAEQGKKNIEWAQKDMPVLNSIRERFKKEQPFKGKKIAMSIHLEAKTAYLAIKGSNLPSPKPTDIGSVGNAAGTDDGYYTSTQLDKLTSKDLEDPKVYAKAMRSLKRL